MILGLLITEIVLKKPCRIHSTWKYKNKFREMNMLNPEQLEWSVKIAIIFSGVFLWVGMMTGVWKYVQIAKSDMARAHYYVDIAHRSSLLYAPATLIIAVMAYYSSWSEFVNLSCVLVNLFFFSFAILSYVLHGLLKDTTNQFKQPHQLGKYKLKACLMRSAMIALVLGEIVSTTILLVGVIQNFV